MTCTETTRHILLAWLDSADARIAQLAISSTGAIPDVARSWLHTVVEEPVSNSRIVSLIATARHRGTLAVTSTVIERWLLVRQALDALDSASMAGLGGAARRLTCEDIATLVRDDEATHAMLSASGIRFREFAKIVTGRRFCAGMFHWDECGLSRSWMAKMPLRDWTDFARTMLKMGGLGPMMFPHLNPRRESMRLEEPAMSQSLAVMAESLDRRPDLRGLAAASWLRSPDTHRVSPHLAIVNAPILANGGFVTTVGRAPEDCGVFERSKTRRRFYQEGRFTPTVGLALWPRAHMLRWWRDHPELVHAEAA